METEELYKLLENLVLYKEEQTWLEFKLNKGSITNQACGEYISALSNGACISDKDYGYLVCGISDIAHAIKGTDFSIAKGKEGNQDLELWLRTQLFPKIYFEFFEFKYNGKNICILQIPAAKCEPTHFKKKAYIRINSQKTDLRNFPDLIRKIYNSQKDLSAEIIPNANINDLDLDAVNFARKKFKEKHTGSTISNEIDRWDDTTFLDKARITINGKITNTAIILLGKKESSHYLLPTVAEITWKLDGEEKAYEHFEMPLLLNINRVLGRIRNVKYKFFPDNQLLAIEVNKYETKVILEALNNCIAHQDYSKNSRILLTEKVDKLIFTNAGNFYDGKADDYAFGDKTPEKYRNRWLAQAMVNLNMIDTLGYGIHRMFLEQRKRFFPLPDYSKSDNDKVVLEIYGHSIDINYSKLLIEKSDLELEKVVLLDKVQKKQLINDEAAKMLKKEKLIEGRKPNYYISSKMAAITDKKSEYIKLRGFKDDHYKKLILEYIEKYGSASKTDIILDILPDVLDENQKKNKVRNIVYDMSKRNKTIDNKGSRRIPIWKRIN
jgi:ATP-dependent DNA helicase RecG